MSNSVFLKPDENGNWGKVGTDAAGGMSAQLVFQSGATAIGNGTAVDVSGYAALIIQVTISAVATVAFEASLDGTNYFSISTNSPNATGASQNTTNAAGTTSWRFNVAGFKFFRARISSYGSGTVDIIGYASTASFSPQYLTTQAGSSDTNSATNILQAVGAYNLLFDGANWARQRTMNMNVDGHTGTGYVASPIIAFNGSTWDRVRTAGLADGAASTGLLANGLFAFNGTAWDKVRIDADKNLKVAQSVSAGMSDILTFQSGATATGDGTVQDVSGYNSLVATLTSTGSATIAFEYSMDNVLWVSLPGQLVQNTSSNMSLNTSLTITSTTFIRFNIVGVKYVRFRISAYTSGTIGASAVASTGSVQYLLGTTQAFGNSDSNSVSNTLLGVGAFNLLYDGTNWVRQRTVLSAGDATNSLSANGIYGFNGSTWDKVRTINTGQLRTTLYSSTGVEPRGDATNDGSSGTGAIATSQMGWVGASFDRVRVGKVYKYIEFLNLANATATTVWTPAAGKKFRLMGVQVAVSAAANVGLRDGSAGSPFITFRTSGIDTRTFDFGNGYLSSTVINPLEIYNASGATINVWVHAWGTEE